MLKTASRRKASLTTASFLTIGFLHDEGTAAEIVLKKQIYYMVIPNPSVNLQYSINSSLVCEDRTSEDFGIYEFYYNLFQYISFTRKPIARIPHRGPMA